MKYMFAVFMLFAAPVHAMGPWKSSCVEAVPCEVGDRSYHVKEPDGWDGVSPLPVMLHFHGWARQGTLIVKHQRISGATRRRGVLLVAPNGLGRSWDFWRPDTGDVAFARAVLEDVKARYPINDEQVYVSGYSWGSAMAWRFVCEDGADVTALLAVSGSIEQNETCLTAPAQVRHVHGLNDNVMDFPFGPGLDETYPVHLWREAMGCDEGTNIGPWNAVDFLTFNRTVWDNCADGHVTLDVHPGGHFIPHGWIARQLDELLGLEPSYP
ncbi:MAG: polyhydroxybutyrate depolymerase [Aliishimia sp.]